MASYRPLKKNKWMARRKRNQVEFFLGYFATKEQALEAEGRFDERWPPNYGWNKGTRRHETSTGHFYFT